MKAIIGARLLHSAAVRPRDKPFEITDTRLPGFTLRVQPSGVRSYYVRLDAKRRVALGKVGELKPDEARERCEKVLGNAAHGRPLLEGVAGAAANGITLGEFIDQTYAPWAVANRPRSSAYNLQRLRRCYAHWYARPLASITTHDIEQFGIRRLAAGKNPSTVRRDIAALAGVLTRAVKLGYVTANTARAVERPPIDRSPNVRYLDKDEEARLRAALQERDEEAQEARKSANAWRKERGRELLPELPHYGDHLTPAVLLSLNTGVRRGELLALRWTAVDLKAKQVTIEGATAKSAQTRHIPLNAEAVEALKRWKEQAPDHERVFPVDSVKTAYAALLERAKIVHFRWHDIRHHFASRLVQAGVPLNTVRELLGHGSMAMTVRYAHLAPDQKREAVARLVQP